MKNKIKYTLLNVEGELGLFVNGTISKCPYSGTYLKPGEVKKENVRTLNERAKPNIQMIVEDSACTSRCPLFQLKTETKLHLNCASNRTIEIEEIKET